MIIDRIENAHLYRGIGPHIDAALDYMKNADLSSVISESLDDSAVRVASMNYITKPIDQCVKENHRVDADIHICLEGVEVFGYSNLSNAVPINEYNCEKDKQFFNAEMNYIKLLPGMFALTLTDDVHSAMTADGEPAPAKKILIKCRL